MYADRANMILMTGFLISGMVTVPIALIVLWHMHSKKRRELKVLKENLRMRSMYGNYMVPPGSAHENNRMFATVEGPYDSQRWPTVPNDTEHWAAMRVMLGSREQGRPVGGTTGPAAGPAGDSFVLGTSGQFAGPIYRPAPIMQPNPQQFQYAQQPPPGYPQMMPMNLGACQLGATASQQALSYTNGEPIYPNNQPQWRVCPPQSGPGSTGSLDWVQNLGAVPRQIDFNLDHANTVGGCAPHMEADGDKAASEANSSQPAPPPLPTKMIPASQLAS